ncbi:MAG: Asp-tRNA(Asn)/Glu-tRNA(Gln) amidotransferase A subunit family amidase [Paracoccaceae bacterium]|jgi:Asp-tRNA(Asn)/Glu-tRNA(Gln) amidotransferase A subunit family amidase
MPPFSPAEIEAAERIMGITYSARERKQMADNLEGQIAMAQARRTIMPLNDSPTASRFDPRLSGFVMPNTADRFVPGSGPDIPDLPHDADDIAFAPLTHLSHWIASGQISSHSLTGIYLERMSRLNPVLECFATMTPELALQQASIADANLAKGEYLGPLHGIPYGLKDLIDTAGVTTGWGAEPFRSQIPETDGAVTRILQDAGAVLLGKTTLGALAYGDLWYGGRTRNPWNLNEGSSGSSAGSASATAAGLCGFAIGTETLGSITSPSHRCGTTGLRPTFGRVSRAGAMALCQSLDKIGPICRSVEDTAIVLDVLNGPDADDRGSIAAPFHFDATTNITKLRLGYLPVAFAQGATPVDHAALEMARSLGMTLTPLTLPDLPYPALMNLLYAEAAASFEALTLGDIDDTLVWQEDNAWPNTLRKARFLSAVDHVQLDRLRYTVMQALDQLFKEVDVIIGPFSTGPMLIASNFTGHPCVHLRAGFADLPSRSPGGLNAERLVPPQNTSAALFRVPHGISLWGPLFDEGPMLCVAMALEKAFGVHHIRPDFPR